MSQENQMPVRCFFDMLDNCVAYDSGDNYSGHSTGIHAPVSSSLYNIPSTMKFDSLIGQSAEQLHKYQEGYVAK